MKKKAPISKHQAPENNQALRVSTRDYFAGVALHGICGNPDMKWLDLNKAEVLASVSFAIADAMVARSQKGRAA